MANSFDPLNPQHWANESIAILEENMIAGALVHRDFEDLLAVDGQIVHTRKPAELSAEPYEKGDTVSVQDASVANVEVKLDTMLDTTFRVYDVEQTYSFKNLVEMFMEPAMMAHGRMLDRKILGKVSQFLDNRIGGLGTLSKTTAHDYLVDTNKQFNLQKVSEGGRNLVLTANGQAHMLKTDLFVSAERAGSSNTQRTANLGAKFGMQNWMSLNCPGTSQVTETATTTLTAAAAAGDTVINVTAATNTPTGAYLTVVGDMTPLRVTAVNTLALTVNRPLLNAVANGAVVTPSATGLIDLGAGYASGWNKWIHVDGTGVPRLGQLVAFKAAGGTVHAPEYVIVDVKPSGGDYEIRLDRPLENTLADNDIVCYGPKGDLNFAFQRNAITLVNRPLAIPPMAAGARIGVARSRHMSLRVILSYDQDTKSLKVSIDSLFGIKTLDTQYGCVLLG